MLVKLGEVAEKDEILKKGCEIKRNWGIVGVDGDLSMEERKMRWRIVELIRRERAKGRKVEITNREV